MNFKLSYNWLKEYVKTKESAHDFAAKVSLCGPSIDRVHEAKPDFEKVVVGQIKKITNHPDADKLHVCEVDVGEKNPLTIVCGAPNLQEGQKVPVALVGGRVGEMAIKLAKLRGVESQGMMCSQRELGLGDDHSGLYILPDYIEAGRPLEKAMPMDDSIFDIEVTANRPDAMCVIGLAREAAAILGEKFLYQKSTPCTVIPAKAGTPRQKHGIPAFAGMTEEGTGIIVSGKKELNVKVIEPKLCPRYQAVVMRDVKVEPSPLWLQQRLLASGLRPINNLVDITNYILLEFGQPMHVFDYDKLAGREIIVRLAKKGETILALDGKNYELTDKNLVIADAENPVAVAGVMGGELSAATKDTKTIVFEAANFDPVSVRKTARLLNLHSESSDLFEKGLPPEGTEPALLRAIELAMELAGAKVASKIFDVGNHKPQTKIIKLKTEAVKKLLGVEIKPDKIKAILASLGFKVSGGLEIEAEVPWWRERDMAGEHDLVEEVARIYGYHNLPARLMAGDLPVDFSSQKTFLWEDAAKDTLSAIGFCEVYNYSFVGERPIRNCSSDLGRHLKVANPLSADFEYMRASLAAGLLQNIADNESVFKEIKIFELSKVYLPQGDGLPDEAANLGVAISGDEVEKIFAEVKGALAMVIKRMNLGDFKLSLIEKEHEVFGAGQAVELEVGKTKVGVLGLVNREILHLFGIKSAVGLAEINFQKLISLAKDSPAYQPISKMPDIWLDISVELDKSVLFEDVVNGIRSVDGLIKDVAFLSVYDGEKVPAGKKALALRLTYRDDNRTLTLTEAQAIHDKVVAKLKKEYNIKVR